MRRSLEYTLGSRDLTLAHWRFQGDLADSSPHAATWRQWYPNGLDLQPVGLLDSDYCVGLTENGPTAQYFASTAAKAILPAMYAPLFDMGTGSFTVEIIFRTTNASGGLCRKYWYTEGTEGGWRIKLNTGKPYVVLCGSPVKTLAGATIVNDGRWHYLAVTIDRTNSQVRIFVDGIEDASSPFTIAGMTGNLSAPNSDMEVGYTLGGWIDELCISLEVLTPMAIAARAAGHFVEAPEYDAGLLPNFLPAIDTENDDLRLFLTPFAKQLQERIVSAAGISALPFWDRCPAGFLAHAASNFGFELIGLPFADEAERRLLLKWAVWLYQTKGTPACIAKFIELLGFTATLTEVFSAAAPFVCNYHRMWDRVQVATTTFADDFSSGNLAKWGPPLNLTSRWFIATGELQGTGNGSDDDTNAILFDDATASCLFSVEYTPGTVFDSPSELGFFLRYVDANNWVRIQYQILDAYQILTWKKMTAGASDVGMIGYLDNDLGRFNTGTHTFWVWDDGSDHYTIGFDNQTFVYGYSFACTGVARGKKGLWVNRGRTVRFSSVTVTSHDRAGMAQLYDPDMALRTLQIDMDNPAGDYTASKREYLHRVLPKYVPAGVEIEWI